MSVGELGKGLDGAISIDLGPEHPTRVGLVLIETTIESGHMTNVRLQPGFSHRGAEKLFEVRDARQLLMLADRHDWQSPVHGELGAALACEQLMGLQAPLRAKWLRTALSELSSCTSGLAHLSWLGWQAGDHDAHQSGRALREHARKLWLDLCGNRVHPMVTRLGGVAVDTNDAWLGRVEAWADELARHAQGRLAPIVEQLGEDRIGALDAHAVDVWGLSGPAARAAGVSMDLRPGTAGLVHDQLDWPERTVRSGGTARDRLAQMVVDLALSAELLAQCCRSLPQVTGPVETPLSKIIKLPEGEAWVELEGPLGRSGFHLVSRGERTPWRLRLRTPSFANTQALQTALEGCPVERAALVVASLPWTIGDLDK